MFQLMRIRGAHGLHPNVIAAQQCSPERATAMWRRCADAAWVLKCSNKFFRTGAWNSRVNVRGNTTYTNSCKINISSLTYFFQSNRVKTDIFTAVHLVCTHLYVAHWIDAFSTEATIIGIERVCGCVDVRTEGSRHGLSGKVVTAPISFRKTATCWHWQSWNGFTIEHLATEYPKQCTLHWTRFWSQ